MNIPSMYSPSATANTRYINLILDIEKHEDAPIFQSVKKSDKGWYESCGHTREITGLISGVSIRQEKLINKAWIEVEIERFSIALIATDENNEIATLYINFNVRSSFARSIVCSFKGLDTFVDRPIKFSCYRNKTTWQANMSLFDVNTNQRISRADDYNLWDLWKEMTKQTIVNKKPVTDTSKLDDYIKDLIWEIATLPMNHLPQPAAAKTTTQETISKNEAVLDEILASNSWDDDLPF